MFDFSDDELLELLSAALAAEPLDPGERDRAIAAYTWRTIDAELMALVDDQIMAGGDLRHHGPGNRLVTLEADRASVEVEIGPQDRPTVVGQVTPPQPDVRLRLIRPDGSAQAAPVDEVGRFSLGAVAPGPARLELTLPSGAVLVGEWLVL